MHRYAWPILDNLPFSFTRSEVHRKSHGSTARSPISSIGGKTSLLANGGRLVELEAAAEAWNLVCEAEPHRQLENATVESRSI